MKRVPAEQGTFMETGVGIEAQMSMLLYVQEATMEVKPANLSARKPP
jgi:hypothetical protein